jgi:hypothetical protein
MGSWSGRLSEVGAASGKRRAIGELEKRKGTQDRLPAAPPPTVDAFTDCVINGRAAEATNQMRSSKFRDHTTRTGSQSDQMMQKKRTTQPRITASTHLAHLQDPFSAESAAEQKFKILHVYSLWMGCYS